MLCRHITEPNVQDPTNPSHVYLTGSDPDYYSFVSYCCWRLTITSRISFHRKPITKRQ